MWPVAGLPGSGACIPQDVAIASFLLGSRVVRDGFDLSGGFPHGGHNFGVAALCLCVGVIAPHLLIERPTEDHGFKQQRITAAKVMIQPKKHGGNASIANLILRDPAVLDVLEKAGPRFSVHRYWRTVDQDVVQWPLRSPHSCPLL